MHVRMRTYVCVVCVHACACVVCVFMYVWREEGWGGKRVGWGGREGWEKNIWMSLGLSNSIDSAIVNHYHYRDSRDITIVISSDLH